MVETIIFRIALFIRFLDILEIRDFCAVNA